MDEQDKVTVSLRAPSEDAPRRRLDHRTARCYEVPVMPTNVAAVTPPDDHAPKDAARRPNAPEIEMWKRLTRVRCADASIRMACNDLDSEIEQGRWDAAGVCLRDIMRICERLCEDAHELEAIARVKAEYDGQF